MPVDRCPCGSGSAHDSCCGRYLSGMCTAPTAEALMRSRYSAYVKKAVDYLVKTTHPSSRTDRLAADIASTADNYVWLSLNVVNTQAGAPEDKMGKVEFIAHFRSRDGQVGIHHERSRFRKYEGTWYYVDGKTVV